MKKIIIAVILLTYNLYGLELGNILFDKENSTSMSIAKDLKNLYAQYNIDLETQLSNSTYNSIEQLLKQNKNNFFAIVSKDVISYYNKLNYTDTNIYKKIPAILSLGTEQIHIFAHENKNIDFELNKKYTVYCGEINSHSCIASKNIQKAYGFEFKYIKLKENEIFKNLKNNTIDLYIKVTKAPYSKFQNIEGVNLVELPTNFTMENMYVNSKIDSIQYSFLNDTVHTFASPMVLISNLKDKKYDKLIKNLIKIVVLNKKYLINKNILWQDIDFEYYDYKVFLEVSRKEITQLSEKIRKEDALIF
jgi:hypothetical protein